MMKKEEKIQSPIFISFSIPHSRSDHMGHSPGQQGKHEASKQKWDAVGGDIMMDSGGEVLFKVTQMVADRMETGTQLPCSKLGILRGSPELCDVSVWAGNWPKSSPWSPSKTSSEPLGA